MQVSVNQRGGVLGHEQTAEVHDRVARLIDKSGKVVAERPLEATTTSGVKALATKALSTIAGADTDDKAATKRAKSKVADSMATQVNIDDGDRTVEYSFMSGDDVPPEIADLVRAVLEAPYRAPRNLAKS